MLMVTLILKSILLFKIIVIYSLNSHYNLKKKCESKVEMPCRHRNMVIKVTDWYESNRTKQKKAQKDLDSFYREDRINDLGKTKDAEVDDIQKKIDAWDKYLEQLDWDYKEYERMENERILKELMGATSEAQIRAWITADMEKFNSDIATNY